MTAAAETSRNDKLRVAWEGLGNTRARRTNTAKRAPSMLTHHHHVRVHVCTVYIQCEIQTNPYQSTEQQVCPGETCSKSSKLQGLDNTLARRTNTAKRTLKMLIHHCHVAVLLYTISIVTFVQAPCTDTIVKQEHKH